MFNVAQKSKGRKKIRERYRIMMTAVIVLAVVAAVVANAIRVNNHIELGK